MPFTKIIYSGVIYKLLCGNKFFENNLDQKAILFNLMKQKNVFLLNSFNFLAKSLIVSVFFIKE